MSATMATRLEVETRSANKVRVHELHYECDQCTATVGVHDRYCRMCGKEFIGKTRKVIR